MRIAKTLLLLVLGLSCAGIAQLTTLARQQGSQETAADAVKLLWSSDDSERETARQKLLQLGSAAIQPLISLLKDIREKPPRRFATGKEQEGEEAWEQARRIPKEYNGEEWAEALRKFHRLEITARLQRDAVDILVNLRSDEAI